MILLHADPELAQKKLLFWGGAPGGYQPHKSTNTHLGGP